MSIKIGDNNKISKSTIAETISTGVRREKKNFCEKHPILCSIVISFFVGFILLFSFWKNIITLIERWLNG